MKRICVLMMLLFCCSVLPVNKPNAQFVIVTALIKKVIKAVDLQVQRLQTQTIWLQNAQKVLENAMSQLKLGDIAEWANRQKELYGNYYQELWKVKSTIAYYQKVKDIIDKQLQLVNEYKRYNTLFRKDTHLSAGELSYMGQVYTGIIDESVKNLDQIYLVINAFSTQMSDAERLSIINGASNRIEQNYSDLKQFNNGNLQTILQRAKEKKDVDAVKQLYGIK